MADPAILPPIVDFLPAGSTQVKLTGLMPGTQYTFWISHVTPGPHKSMSAPLIVTLTTASVVATAAAPTNPTSFVGQLDSRGNFRRDGSFGLVVLPGEFPSTIVMEVATETAVGSGTPGTFAQAGRPELARVTTAGVVNLTPLLAYAANDNLKRFARAYATRDGALPSAYTAAIAIAPWGNPQPLLIAGVIGGGTPQ